MTAPTIITATEMQKKSGQILKRIAKHHETFMVERDGFPVAVILSVETFRLSCQSPPQTSGNLLAEEER